MLTTHIVMEVEGMGLEQDMMILTGATQRAEMESVFAAGVLIMSHRTVWLICQRRSRNVSSTITPTEDTLSLALTQLPADDLLSYYVCVS
jgi:hypothetical protein